MPMRTREEQRAYQRKWLADRRNKGIEILGGKCVKCHNTEGLEFDHIDPSTKHPKLVGVTNTFWSWSWNRIHEELKKCQLLCHDCHKKKTVDFLKSTRKSCDKHYFGKKKCTCN